MKPKESERPIELLVAIIAEMRYRANNHRQDGWESVGEELDDLADRIERANVRALALLAEERARLEAKAESEKRWADDYFELARRREDALVHCRQYAQKIERENEEGETRLDAEEIIATVDNEFAGIRPKSAPCNAAALREAMGEIMLLTVKAGKSLRSDVACGIIASKARHALAAPARNCDVGTSQEQIDRFHEFCHSNRYYIDEFHGYDCRPDCPIGKIVDRDDKFCDNCWAAWAQMPYEKGGAVCSSR